MHASRQWVSTLPSTCATKGVWHVIMDTLGIEPRAVCMRSGCDTTTPCARHSQLACAVAHWASRQLQVMAPWGGLSPKTATRYNKSWTHRDTLDASGNVLDTSGGVLDTFRKVLGASGHLGAHPEHQQKCPGEDASLAGDASGELSPRPGGPMAKTWVCSLRMVAGCRPGCGCHVLGSFRTATNIASWEASHPATGFPSICRGLHPGKLRMMDLRTYATPLHADSMVKV